tara:strand:+ start:2656 stop:2820 length:165 start_codon:yes stop_codon:yes gene_type:complete
MIGVNDMANGAVSLTSQAVPALKLAMNQTVAMIARLEQLAKNPTIQLSLAQSGR